MLLQRMDGWTMDCIRNEEYEKDWTYEFSKYNSVRKANHMLFPTLIPLRRFKRSFEGPYTFERSEGPIDSRQGREQLNRVWLDSQQLLNRTQQAMEDGDVHGLEGRDLEDTNDASAARLGSKLQFEVDEWCFCEPGSAHATSLRMAKMLHVFALGGTVLRHYNASRPHAYGDSRIVIFSRGKVG
ncbi:hypothetical protein AC579_2866 [Pseudocercospora musae]|uniref:Uncharacterized protein n=1 Tax=Pseudocercospora musae TaxID=113226 RepID=A0A139IUG9_9PEZI|nr:hypothetical protein AC579_2866 [Pseudocercospora musae]